jgi:hypothetical protein
VHDCLRHFGASISNTATLTDSTDTIATGTSNDSIPVSTEAPQVDSHLSQIMLSGSTYIGLCAAGNMTLTATDQLKNTGGSTLTNPYAVVLYPVGREFAAIGVGGLKQPGLKRERDIYVPHQVGKVRYVPTLVRRSKQLGFDRDFQTGKQGIAASTGSGT